MHAPAEPVILRDDDPAYGAWKAAVLAGEAAVLSERQVAPGVREVVFGPPPRLPNVPAVQLTRQIRISGRFLQGPKDDYRNWREAWWREVVQNGVDAGARTIQLEAVEEPEAMRLSCADDGAGMDVRTVLDKFLVLGETGKGAGTDTVGGFGKAKELELLPWIAWEVHTRDLVIRGQGDAYGEPERAPYRQGTLVTVWMDKNECTTADHARSFVAKCHLPRVAFTVNGDVVYANDRPGRLVREFKSEHGDVQLTVYHTKRTPSNGQLPVRVRGVWMFSRMISDKMPGRLIAELDGPADGIRRTLQSNRDGFRDYRLGGALDELAQELARDVLTALAKKKNRYERFYKGQGSVDQASRLAQELVTLAGAFSPKRRKGERDEDAGLVDQALSADTLAQAQAIVLDRWQAAPPATPEEAAVRAQPPVVQVHLEQGFRTPAEVERALAALAWMPDIIVAQSIDYFRPPKAWMPGEGMGKIPLRTLRLWAEMCRFVMIGLGQHEPVGIGWTFSLDVRGECETRPHPETGEMSKWLLYNPLVVEPDRYDERKFASVRPRVRLSDEATIASMFSTAVHEVTHLRHTDHDEAFISAYGEAMARLLPRWPLVRKLKAAVTRASMGEREGSPEPETAPVGDDPLEEATAGHAPTQPSATVSSGAAWTAWSVWCKLVELRAGDHPIIVQDVWEQLPEPLRRYEVVDFLVARAETAAQVVRWKKTPAEARRLMLDTLRMLRSSSEADVRYRLYEEHGIVDAQALVNAVVDVAQAVGVS